ncbi:hypothetical protein ACSSS7_006681 [Eimeria intestinalis]
MSNSFSACVLLQQSAEVREGFLAAALPPTLDLLGLQILRLKEEKNACNERECLGLEEREIEGEQPPQQQQQQQEPPHQQKQQQMGQHQQQEQQPTAASHTLSDLEAENDTHMQEDRLTSAENAGKEKEEDPKEFSLFGDDE